MGGDGAWEFLQRYPNCFAAALPMGMNFHGDPQKIKGIPIWTNQGETDPFSKTLKADVWNIRKLNGDDVDSNQNWVTGVNPRYTNFEGYGHVVQWPAASTQDLTGWAYEKVNDGNKYPVVFFRTPDYKQVVRQNASVSVEVAATDPDGSISKVEIKFNGIVKTTLLHVPFKTIINAPAGDAIIEAVVYDNKGKHSVATTMIKSDVKTTFLTPDLSFARQGAYYKKQLSVFGNGLIRYSLVGSASLPLGLSLSASGLISGVPQTIGNYPLTLIAKDEDGDSAIRRYTLTIVKKAGNEVLVTKAVNDSGVVFPVSKLQLGSMIQFNKGDDEITVSNTAGFDGMTLLLGNARDTNRIEAEYLSFDVDEDARVYVAYEKKDNLFTSTIPTWLQSWQRSPSLQIVAQYFYYDVYYKDFPKGKVTLPGADEKHNNVTNNYFILVRKAESPFQFPLEINTDGLSRGNVGIPYKEQLTALHGAGGLVWSITKGALPKGLRLTQQGLIEGTPEAKGVFNFSATVGDKKGFTNAKRFVLEISN